MPELLPSVDVGEVHLDKRHSDTEKSVAECNRVVCKGRWLSIVFPPLSDVRSHTWVDDDGVRAIRPRLVDAVDQCSLPVTLEEVDVPVQAGRLLPRCCHHVVESVGAIH